jgi:hypothetical protein
MSARNRVGAALLPVCGLIVTQVLSQPHISGDLSGILGPGTYIVDGNCQVLDGDSLNILPGTEFQHTGNYNWMIYGQLTAEGDENDSIKFIPLSPEPAYYWGGIRFVPTYPVQNSLDYCVIDGAHNYAVSPGAGIYVERNTTSIRNSRISNCDAYFKGGGIYAYRSSMLLIESCLIENCESNYGGGIQLNLCSGAEIRNCTIINNTSEGG